MPEAGRAKRTDLVNQGIEALQQAIELRPGI